MTIISLNPVCKHITFVQWDDPKRKTKVWEVRANKGNHLLGHVRWFGRWRCYAFSPMPETVFENQCLTDLASWCSLTTYQHLESKRQERPKIAKGNPS